LIEKVRKEFNISIKDDLFEISKEQLETKGQLYYDQNF